MQATWCFITTLCNTDERAANQRTFGCIVAQTLRNYNCGLLFRFEESVTVFFQSLTDFVVSEFCFRFCWCLRFFTQTSDFCLDWFTQIFVQIFASDFFGVSDFSLRFFKSFRFFSFQISDELQILEMAQIFSHSDFRRFRFSPDF